MKFTMGAFRACVSSWNSPKWICSWYKS